MFISLSKRVGNVPENEMVSSKHRQFPYTKPSIMAFHKGD